MKRKHATDMTPNSLILVCIGVTPVVLSPSAPKSIYPAVNVAALSASTSSEGMYTALL
jgi:hypothetical protein